jgi:hypothetical protein
MKQNFIKIKNFLIDEDYKIAFQKLGLNSIDDVFSFSAGRNLAKKNLAFFRSRLCFDIDSPKTALFLKRYISPPVHLQLKNWLMHHSRKTSGRIDFEIPILLSSLGINTPRVIAFGEQTGILFEKRSFCITEQIPNAEAIERKLPDYFASNNARSRLLQKNFIRNLALFIKKFHDTGYRHRDLYFSHIFCDDTGRFFLIDLSRTFRPLLLSQYFRVKDIAQLFYSAPAAFFSKTDRLRFYFSYAGCRRLSKNDKQFIISVIKKVRQIAHHDIKHHRPVPCEIS